MSRRLVRDVQTIAGWLEAAGALWVRVASEGKVCALECEMTPETPDAVEDRVESWLHALDPEGKARLETALEAGPWLPGWEGIYRGALVPPFHVRPPWAATAPDLMSIMIDPRGGFGSGNHPTTRLTLTLLARAARGLGDAGRAALDVGCGSGVLSIALARLGLQASAIDIEPQAREATRRAASGNGVTVRVIDAGLDAAPGPFACVVANLNPQAAMDLAGALAARTAPGGALVLGGFHPPQVPALTAASGLGEGEALLSPDGAWAGLLLQRS